MAEALAEAMTKVMKVLSPLEADERRRVVQAVFALLGDPAPVAGKALGSPQQAAEESDVELPGVAPAVAKWLAKAQITKEQLENIFHFENEKVKVIDLPGGATKRIDQVINTYLMQGIASYLQTGDPSFTDQDARDLCETFGCYDKTNHAKYLKAFGNKITGSKGAGWKLTTPGISAAAELIKA